MDFIEFADVSFRPNANIGHLCEELNKVIGEAVWHDTFKIQNTKCLWFVNDIVAAINNDEALCGRFGLYPSYVAGILNLVKQINFYVLCNKMLNYVDLLEKLFPVKDALLRSFQKFVLCYNLVKKEWL
jgi:hypothetical protein